MDSHPISPRLPQPQVAPTRDATGREEPGRRSAEERRRRKRRWAEAQQEAGGEASAAPEDRSAAPRPGTPEVRFHRAPGNEAPPIDGDEDDPAATPLDARGRRLDIRV